MLVPVLAHNEIGRSRTDTSCMNGGYAAQVSLGEICPEISPLVKPNRAWPNILFHLIKSSVK